jgi:hypothetical protein
MKYLAVALTIVLCMASVVAAEGLFFAQFNSLQELHDDFTSNPVLSAGYIQGVVDMESLEAMAANDGKENALHLCLVSNPELSNAPKISVLVDEWYSSHPDDRTGSAAIAIVGVLNKACGISGSHEGLGIHMGKPSAVKPKPAPPVMGGSRS